MDKVIKYSTNWNNKLHCNSFTTLRLRNDAKYVLGEGYDIALKGRPYGRVRILAIKHIWLVDINEYIARLDTGYSAKECVQIIKTMYPDANWAKQQLSLILQERIEPIPTKDLFNP